MSISRIKKETVTIDSESPSSYTRLGVEAKRWLQTNPKITRTAESQLKSINAPVLRKSIALEKAKTPQKKNPTPRKSSHTINAPSKILKFSLTPIQDTSVTSSPSSSVTNLDVIVQQLKNSPHPSCLREKLLKLAAGVPLPDRPYPAITFNPVSIEGHSDTVEDHSDSHESSLSRTESLYNEFNFKKKQFFASMGKKTNPFKAFPSAVRLWMSLLLQ